MQLSVAALAALRKNGGCCVVAITKKPPDPTIPEIIGVKVSKAGLSLEQDWAREFGPCFCHSSRRHN